MHISLSLSVVFLILYSIFLAFFPYVVSLPCTVSYFLFFILKSSLLCEPACLIGFAAGTCEFHQKGYFYCVLCTQKNKIILKCAQQADERYYDGFHHYHLTHSYIHKQHSCNEAPDRKLLRLLNTGAHICIPLVATIRIPFVSMLKYSSKGIYIKLYKHSCSLVLFLMCLQQLLYLTGNLNIYSITLRNIVSGWLFKNCYGQSMYSCTEYKLWSFKQGQHCQIIWITFLILIEHAT